VGVEKWNCYGDDLWWSSNTREQHMGTKFVNQGGGGNPYDNGHYGNIGFIDGRYVLPMVKDYEESDGNENDNANIGERYPEAPENQQADQVVVGSVSDEYCDAVQSAHPRDMSVITDNDDGCTENAPD
jgi:hypothetical protein